MFEIRKTEPFAKWLDGLAGIRALARIQVRIERLAKENLSVRVFLSYELITIHAIVSITKSVW